MKEKKAYRGIRASQYGKPFSARFKKRTEKLLIDFCAKNSLNESNVIQTAVDCFFFNENCEMRKKILQQ